MLTQSEPATRAEFEAQLLATNSRTMRLLHHRENAEYVEAHHVLDLLLARWESCP